MFRWQSVACALVVLVSGFGASISVHAQAMSARTLLESAADAMGGLDRLERLDALVMTGFGQYLNQQGGANPSPDPHAPAKWQAANSAERVFDLRGGRAVSRDRRNYMFPYAMASGMSWSPFEQVQEGAAALDHPLPALLTALRPTTRLGAVSIDEGLVVVEFTPSGAQPVWLALDPGTHLPAWYRWVAPSATLGDLTHTAYFTGYLPFGDVRLPVGLSTVTDWRDTTVSYFHVDSYDFDADLAAAFPQRSTRGAPSAVVAEATPLADGVWDVRFGGNGGAVIEFADHLTMFEAYGSEAATFARLDLANTLVPGKRVTEVIVSHHHFDHSGGLRAAVSRGLQIISQSGNEQIFREMVARPAPLFPDALARNPLPLEFVPVDEHLTLDDGTMRVDVYHVVGHLHMANAVFAFVPGPRIFLEGDFTTFDWDMNWWGGAYLDNVERYGLDPAINVPTHGIVTSFADAVSGIEAQVRRARAFCADGAERGFYQAGCPVKFSRD